MLALSRRVVSGVSSGVSRTIGVASALPNNLINNNKRLQNQHCGKCGLSTYTGQCLCGQVKYSLEGKPVAVVDCHCSQCRRAHSAPYAPLAIYETDKLKVTEGQAALNVYRTGGNEFRYFCNKCSGKVYSHLRHFNKHAAFIDNIDGHGPDGKLRPEFKPQFHIFYGSGILSVFDGLPKYETLPKGFGGDDKTLPDNFHEKR